MNARNFEHPYPAAVSFDGGNLDCGNGLLLLIRKHIDPLHRGQLLEILSAESSVREDLPSWCRLTGNDLVSQVDRDDKTSFLVCKGPFEAQDSATTAQPSQEVHRDSSFVSAQAVGGERIAMPMTQPVAEVIVPDSLPVPTDAPEIGPMSVMGIGSWPRPRWLLRALHEYLEGRLDEAEFQETADDGVRLVLEAQSAPACTW